MKKTIFTILLFILLFFKLPAASIETLMQQAEQKESEQNYSEALKLYEQVLQIEPENEKASRKIVFLEKKLSSVDSRYEAQNYISLIKNANRLYEKGKYADAKQEYDKALQNKPNSLEAMLGKAKSLYWTNEREESFELLKKILEIDENYLAALVQTAQFYYLSGNYQEAAIYYEKLLDYDDLSEFEPEDIYLNAGITFGRIDAKQKAHQAYEKGMAAFPQNYKFAFFNGQLYFDEEKYETALLWFRKAVELKNDDSLNWYYMGLCHFFQNVYSQAKSNLETALTIAPDFNNAKYYLAVIQIVQMNDFEKAVDYLNDFIAANPNHAESYFWRSSAYIFLQRYREAMIDVEKTLLIDPNNKQALEYKSMLEKKLQ